MKGCNKSPESAIYASDFLRSNLQRLHFCCLGVPRFAQSRCSIAGYCRSQALNLPSCLACLTTDGLIVTLLLWQNEREPTVGNRLAVEPQISFVGKTFACAQKQQYLGWRPVEERKSHTAATSRLSDASFTTAHVLCSVSV